MESGNTFRKQVIHVTMECRRACIFVAMVLMDPVNSIKTA